MKRRKFLAVTIPALAGCITPENTGNSDENTGDSEEELYESWEDNDDYPEDDFRNHKTFEKGIGMVSQNETETTFGFHTTSIISSSIMEETYTEQDSFEIIIDADKEVDVYIIPEDVESELLDDPASLSDFNHIPDYSNFGVENYQEVIRTDEEDVVYTIVVTLHDVHPPSTFEEQMEFTENYDEAQLEGRIEQAVYIPFEEFKNNEEARGLYELESEYMF